MHLLAYRFGSRALLAAMCLMFSACGASGLLVAKQSTSLPNVRPHLECEGAKKGAKFAIPDGTCPEAGLVKVGTYLYGTTADGGANNDGVIFQITTTGSEMTLHDFAPFEGYFPSTLTHVGCCLYGVLWAGDLGYGSIFKYNLSTNHFSILHDFAGTDGDGPRGRLFNDGGVLYGTTRSGGSNSQGTIFSITTGGVFTPLYSFQSTPDAVGPNGLVKIGNAFYGSSEGGGTFGGGALFQFTPPSSEGVIYSFQGGSADGSLPEGDVIAVGGLLYGTTVQGGPEDFGTVFQATTTGSETVLHSFDAQGAQSGDGEDPIAGLVNVGNTLYGTTIGGGQHHWGTVFSEPLAGGNDTILRNFRDNANDGRTPVAPLLYAGGKLYGTLEAGGPNEQGAVFKITTGGHEHVLHFF